MAERPPRDSDSDKPLVRAEILGAVVRDTTWFQPLKRHIYLSPGIAAPDLLRVPVGDAQLILRHTVGTAAGLPDAKASEVVWTLGRSELRVRLNGVGLACAPGTITIGVPVGCDQVPSGASVQIHFAVGTEKMPSGLIMSTFQQPAGPAVIVDMWAEALTAFAWAAIIHLAQSLCGAAGTDSASSPLVPGHIGAELDLLLLQPMARHRPKGRPS